MGRLIKKQPIRDRAEYCFIDLQSVGVEKSSAVEASSLCYSQDLIRKTATKDLVAAGPEWNFLKTVLNLP